MRPVSKEFIFIVLLFSLTFLSLELALILLSRMSRKVAAAVTPTWYTFAITLPDKHLGSRGHPAFLEHDRDGFRNPYVPKAADIVVFGDSQAYGVGVRPFEAWPRILESMLDKKVYSMAFSGFGPVHHLFLWRKACTYQPKIVIMALYSGNDLFDSFDLVYNGGQLQKFKTQDPAVQEKIGAVETSEKLAQEISRLLNDNNLLMGIHQKGIDQRPSFVRFLAEHSKLYGLSQRISYEIWHFFGGQTASEEDLWKVAEEIQREEPGYFEIFKKGQVRTLFTSEYRLKGLNLQDPRIREGEQILLRAIARMNELSAEENIRFLVLLIPTKEFVFRDLVENPSDDYKALIANEEVFWGETVDFFKERGIEYIEALPALRAQLNAGKQPYRIIRDGHPNEVGHHTIAQLLKEKLSENPVTASVSK